MFVVHSDALLGASRECSVSRRWNLIVRAVSDGSAGLRHGSFKSESIDVLWFRKRVNPRAGRSFSQN